MAESLYGKIGEKGFNLLLSSPIGCDEIAVPVEPGNGVIPRGTVLYRKDSGMFAPATASEVVTTNYLVVSNEDTDSSADAQVANNIAAYRAGSFVAGRVKLAGGAALSIANVVTLRAMGIVFNVAEDAAKFENKVG